MITQNFSRISVFWTIFFLIILNNKGISLDINKDSIKQTINTEYKILVKHLYNGSDSTSYYISRLEALNKKINDKNVWFNIQLVKATLLSKSKEKEGLHDLYKQMKSEFENVPREKHAFFFHSLGMYYYRLDELDSSSYYFNRVVQSLDTTWADYYNLSVSSYNNLAAISKLQYDYSTSFEHLEKYESFLDQHSENDSIQNKKLSQLYNKKGNLYKHIRNFSQAHKSLKLSLEHSRSISDSLRTLHNIGLNYLAEGDTIAGKQIFEDLIKNKESMNQNTKTVTFAELFNIYFEEQNLSKASEYFKFYVEAAEQGRGKYNQNMIIPRRARLEYLKSNYQDANSLFQESIDFFKKDRNRYKYELKTAREYYLLSLQKNNSRNVDYASVLQNHLNNIDKIRDEEKELNLAGQMIKFDTEKRLSNKEKEIARQKLKTYNQVKANRLLGIILFVVLLLSLFIYKRQKKKSQLVRRNNKRLLKKNNELIKKLNTISPKLSVNKELNKNIDFIYSQTLILNSKEKIYLANLIYLEKKGDLIYFHEMGGGNEKKEIGTLKNYSENILLVPSFLRIHNSYLINSRLIKHFSSTKIVLEFNNEIIILPIGRAFGSNVLKILQKLHNDKKVTNRIINNI